MSKIRIFRGLLVFSAFCLGASLTTGSIMEKYRDPLDQMLGTKSSTTVTEETSDPEEMWNFKSDFKTAEEAFNGYKEFAIKEADETLALLKNENSALPLAKTAKVTMFGLRSYAPVYGNSGGSTPDVRTIEDNFITDCLKDAGLQLNPSMLATYEKAFPEESWATGGGFGATNAEYTNMGSIGNEEAGEVQELSLAELTALNPSFRSDYSSYNDAAIVVLGRPGGESKNYYTGNQSDSTTKNIMGLTSEEREIIKEAKDNFSKVIVLINSTTTMEFKELKDDKDISAIMWIGYPGAYGFRSVAKTLIGEVNPSGYLGDIHATNGMTSPALQSFGNVPWANVADFPEGSNINSYLVEAEGIYQGYRYYETRYADIVNGVANASFASANTYTTGDGVLATTSGTWDYTQEVVYPFGAGLSYTSFEETLDSISITGDKKTANVSVTIKNTGDVAGKKAVQVYAQSPYTQYDKDNDVEKSAVQLLDYEKSVLLDPNESQTINMKIDLANLASYDSKNAKTYIADDGKYYMALGDNSHDALNNILASQGKTTADGMDYNGNASKVKDWTWSGSENGVDKDAFSVSKAGVNITNHLSGDNNDTDYSMDLNTFKPDTVTYLTRQDWNGTFPKSYSGLEITGRLEALLQNDFIDIKTDEDTSDFLWSQGSSLTLNDLKGASFDDPRFTELVDNMSITEFLEFAQSAFHHIQKIDSVGYIGNDADDGPGGSDTHYLNTGTYRGEVWADAQNYGATNTGKTGFGRFAYGTRVAPTPTNLAYSFNKELAYENGEIILGETSLCLNLPIVIGPGGNLHRHGYNGRGGEYYSEDPILSGYTGSAVVQGAQSKGCLVNIKHAAFNDQEINRSGVAVFMNEQKARELELRNLSQMFEYNGKPAAFENDPTKDNTYKVGALGVMTSYNRIGAVASSSNKSLMVDIMRKEWGFNGYNVTDFTGVSLRASPKESILAGTTAFCGFGVSVDYWNEEALKNDRAMCTAIKENSHYILYSLANSNALNGINSSSRKVELNTPWRIGYKSAIGVTAAMTGLSGALLIFFFTLKSLKPKGGK